MNEVTTKGAMEFSDRMAWISINASIGLPLIAGFGLLLDVLPGDREVVSSTILALFCIQIVILLMGISGLFGAKGKNRTGVLIRGSIGIILGDISAVILYILAMFAGMTL